MKHKARYPMWHLIAFLLVGVLGVTLGLALTRGNNRPQAPQRPIPQERIIPDTTYPTPGSEWSRPQVPVTPKIKPRHKRPKPSPPMMGPGD